MDRIIWKLVGLLLGLTIVMGASLIITKTAEAAEWSAWQDVKQASYYSGYGSASGIHAKNKVAVPVSRIVKKSKWKKLSKAKKRRYFYYGERLTLRVVKGRYKGAQRTFTVVDCGLFGNSGGYIGKGKHKRRVSRLFDLHQSGIRHFLGTREGVCYVTWRYQK